ncbi:MAG: hypothetical protein J1F35_03420 [Erysipelotrichales bacterium]|nr:hypothetical protein [Erysipelotrichales bacterium]
MKKVYILGNNSYCLKIIPTLEKIGGKNDNEFSEEELSNENNIFYIDWFEDNLIKFINKDTVLGSEILTCWKKICPLTSINELPQDWDSAYANYESLQKYMNGEDGKLDTKMDYLGRVIILRDIYRQGWIPEYNDQVYHIKYDLSIKDLTILKGIGISKLLSFKTLELAEAFKENFNNLLTAVQEYL